MDDLATNYIIALTRIERACDLGADLDAIKRIATDAINATPLGAA